jgi:hypothetical protein
MPRPSLYDIDFIAFNFMGPAPTSGSFDYDASAAVGSTIHRFHRRLAGHHVRPCGCRQQPGRSRCHYQRMYPVPRFRRLLRRTPQPVQLLVPEHRLGRHSRRFRRHGFVWNRNRRAKRRQQPASRRSRAKKLARTVGRSPPLLLIPAHCLCC